MNIDKIKSNCRKPNVFISFRDSINVSLINPRNIYGTPTGTYSYPAIDFLSKIEECKSIYEFLNIFPFKGKNTPRFIYFYYLDNRSVAFDDNSTFDEIKPYYEKLIKLYKGKSDYFDKIMDNVQKYINDEKEKEDENDWGFSGMMSFNVFKVHDIRNSENKSEAHKLWTLTYHMAEDDSTKWGNIFRKIGVDAFIDHGEGYIHPNEPSQAVLLNQKMFNNYEIIEIDDTASYKNDIKKALENDDNIDLDKLEKVYFKDPGFVFNVFLYKVKKGDYRFIDNYTEFIIMNKNNKIINNVLQIFVDNLDKTRVTKLDNRLIKLLIDKFGDLFYKNYINAYLKYKPQFDLGDKEDISRKLLVGSLLFANKEKTVDFLKRNKEYNFKEELEFLHDDPKLIKKYSSIHSLYFGDVANAWDFMKEESPNEKRDREELEHRYELFKDAYEKATGTFWSYDKFKQRSQNWKFYGDHNGYVAIRLQASGYYKLVGAAGDFKSVMRGLNDLIKEDKPVWGMMTQDLVNILVKRYGFYQPPKRIFKYLFKLIAPKTLSGAKIDDDGGVIIDYEDTGKSKKYFVGNKKYYIELLNHEFFDKNKILKKMLRFFIMTRQRKLRHL
jgi:hypothetical protein